MIALLVSTLALGLVGSTHCAAMCGGIVAASHVGARGKRALPTFRQRASIVLAQNAGRIVSYALAGALAGGLGQVAGSAYAEKGRIALQLFAALALLLAGTTLAGLVPARWSAERLGVPLWRRIGPHARALLPLSTPTRGLGFGLLWGFLPCGLVYSAVSLAAASSSVTTGALTMLAFGAGTLPMLLGLGAAASHLGALVRRPLTRTLAGLLVTGFGALQLLLVARELHAPRSCCPPGAHANSTVSAGDG